MVKKSVKVSQLPFRPKPPHVRSTAGKEGEERGKRQGTNPVTRVVRDFISLRGFITSPGFIFISPSYLVNEREWNNVNTSRFYTVYIFGAFNKIILTDIIKTLSVFALLADWRKSQWLRFCLSYIIFSTVYKYFKQMTSRPTKYLCQN